MCTSAPLFFPLLFPAPTKPPENQSELFFLGHLSAVLQSSTVVTAWQPPSTVIASASVAFDQESSILWQSPPPGQHDLTLSFLMALSSLHSIPPPGITSRSGSPCPQVGVLQEPVVGLLSLHRSTRFPRWACPHPPLKLLPLFLSLFPGPAPSDILLCIPSSSWTSWAGGSPFGKASKRLLLPTLAWKGGFRRC